MLLLLKNFINIILNVELIPIWLAVSLSFLVLYIMRFYSKEKKELIDYLKLIVAIAFAILYSVPENYGIPLELYNSSIISIAAVVFINDRIFLNPKIMRNSLRTALIIESVLVILFLLFAFAQKVAADQQRELAEQTYYELSELLDETREQLEECKEKNP